MGTFKPDRTTYKLNFSDTGLAGLEVTARGTTVNGLREFIRLGAELDGMDEIDPAEVDEKLTGMFAPFARVLVSWNVVSDDDKPVPATLDGLLDQEPAFLGQVIEAYVQAISQAPPPLPSRSSAGATTANPVEESIPVTPMASLPSSPGPG